jgi:hypothetical protein
VVAPVLGFLNCRTSTLSLTAPAETRQTHNLPGLNSGSVAALLYSSCNLLHNFYFKIDETATPKITSLLYKS